MNKDTIQFGIQASHEGRHDEAIAILNRAIDSGNRTDLVLYHLARSLFKTKRFAESLRYWEDLSKQYSDTENLDAKIKIRINLSVSNYMAAKMKVKEGRYDEAIELLKKYSRYYPGDKKAKKIISNLKKLLSDIHVMQNHLRMASEYINRGLWSEASKELMVLYLKHNNSIEEGGQNA